MNAKTLMYILKRIGLAVLTVWVVITVTFFVMRAVPGGPFLGEKAVTEAAQAALEAKYGLDKPVTVQSIPYLRDVVTKLDFGPSIKLRGRMVIDVIADGLKTSAKLGVILYFSARLSKRNTEKKRRFNKRTYTGHFLELLDRIGFLELVPYGVVLAVIAGLLLLQPHLSATILILAIGASILFAAGIRLGWFVAGGSLMAAALWVVVNATDYMADRIAIWQDPWSDIQGDGYQIVQSLYSIGSGGLLGLGFGNSRQKFLYLPELQNDYVFPIVCEELGFIGAAMILLLFALLIIRGYWLALHARDRFGALLIVGVTTQVAVQVFLNIGVVTNLIPPTGISLPFFSYGGTALVIQLVEMGIVLSVSRQIPAPKAG